MLIDTTKITLYIHMNLTALFLDIEKGIFTTDEGKEITYYRLHLYDPKTHEYHKLPVSSEIADKAEDCSIGDEITVTVAMRKKFGTDREELKVIAWD